ncbi:MAG TPA: 4-hydroxy-tetrahydrodipicolinate reductase [Chitinophagaceae bacterium]
MKIALIGYGKMGKAIEAIALSRGHEIVLRITRSNAGDCTAANLSKADMAIEFTSPRSAVDNLQRLFDAGLPVVCGSTGWLERWEAVKQYCESRNGSFIYASNFSIGVNLFFELNTFLAKLMNNHSAYDVSIEEIHHTQKKDAPSGTAITLAEQVMRQIGTKRRWVNDSSSNKSDLVITSKRIDPAPGTHTVKYHSEIDDIEITHTAHSREGFAAGAVAAAEFLQGKKGIYTMKDVLGL